MSGETVVNPEVAKRRAEMCDPFYLRGLAVGTKAGIDAGLAAAVHRARENSRRAHDGRRALQDFGIPMTGAQWKRVSMWLEAFAKDK